MDIRGEHTWCADCTAPRIPAAHAPLIALFLDALPAWRASGGMTPVLMEGFDRAELAALIAHAPADLPVTPREAFAALLEMEGEYRRIRAAQTAAAPVQGEMTRQHGSMLS